MLLGNYFKIIVAACVLFFLVSCNYGMVGAQQNIDTTSQNDVEISDITPIPTNNISAADYIVFTVSNNLSTPIFLTSKSISRGKSNLIDTSACSTIGANANCNIKLYLQNQSFNGAMLNLVYKDNANTQYKLQRILSFSNNMPANNGFIYNINQFNITNTKFGYINVPFRLDDNYSNLHVMLDNNEIKFSCSQNGYYKNNLCTAMINKSLISSQNEFKIITNVGGNKIISKMLLFIANNSSANIISSAVNTVISPDNGTSPVQVFLQNNGTATASGIVISGINPVVISGPNTCSSTLAANATCSFYVNVTGAVASGQSTLAITYNDGSNTQAIYSNVIYISPIPAPSLSVIGSGNLQNKVINTGALFYTITITNTGSNNLSNLQFTNVVSLVTSMSSGASGSTCSNGQTLIIGGSCTLILSYDPSATASGAVNFIPTATYVDGGGNSITYSNSSLVIPYSAVSGATFVTAGDFGMVFSSPVGAVGTWTANVNSPFATTSTGANDIYINSNDGTYVMPLTTGVVKYSTLNGLFWQSTGATNIDASTCNITYDGSFYYTCGTTNGSFDSCTNNRGCILRSNNLVGTWSGLYSPPAAVLINGVYYFNNGINSAYVATFPNTTANTGLATSTNGSTWSATSSAQATAANNNFTPVVLNTTTNNLTAWNSVGFSSSEPISTVGTTWTANTSTRPANNKVTSALFQGSLYVLTMLNGSIYTATSPTGAYTQENPGTGVQLNKVIYAPGISGGTYIAYGNTGINRTATNPTGTWTTQTAVITGQATNPNILGAFYDGTNVWATGVSTLLKSNNATTYVTPEIQSITKNGTSYLAVDNQGYIYSSSDLATWIEQTNPTSNILNSVYCAGNDLCFAVGNGGTILKTMDGGQNWLQQTSNTTNTLENITCNLGLCVIVGGDGTSNTGTVITSSDYSTWSIATSSLATTSLNNATYYNGMYIAVGNGGVIFTSTNGQSWTSRTSGVATNLNSIACANNLGCSAVGDSGVIRYSAFGLTWAAATSSTTNDIMSVTTSGDRFVAVGKGGVIRYSTTGTGTWTASTFPTTSSATNNLNAVILK